jgi:hypothetical protein
MSAECTFSSPSDCVRAWRTAAAVAEPPSFSLAGGPGSRSNDEGPFANNDRERSQYRAAAAATAAAATATAAARHRSGRGEGVAESLVDEDLRGLEQVGVQLLGGQLAALQTVHVLLLALAGRVPGLEHGACVRRRRSGRVGGRAVAPRMAARCGAGFSVLTTDSTLTRSSHRVSVLLLMKSCVYAAAG